MPMFMVFPTGNSTRYNFEATAVASQLSEDFVCDIRDLEKLRCHIETIQPEFIFHLAAQPIVTEAYLNPIQTFSTNALGTLNILEALKGLEAVTCVLITSDKVYENHEWIWGYRENDALGAKIHTALQNQWLKLNPLIF